MNNFLTTYFKGFWDKLAGDRRLQIINLAESRARGEVLDCGCDDGTSTVRMMKKLKIKNIHAIEINKAAAKEAVKRGIKVKIADLNIPFPYRNSRFDLIIADQVIEHLWNLDNFTSEIKRILKKGGTAIISTENLASWHNIMALVLGLQPFTVPSLSRLKVVGFHPLTPTFEIIAKRYKDATQTPEHNKVMTLTGLISLFKVYGFDIKEIACVGYFPFSGSVGRFLSSIDKRHSFFITIAVWKK